MAENNQKLRIKDIALLAGVSEGTVDRVLHNRGDVSTKSSLAVNKVLEEMNYSPNLLARSLASKKSYHFMALFPSFTAGEYWEEVDKGFELASQDFLHHNVLIEKRYFNQYDVQSFVSASASILSAQPDAVFIAPVFRTETLALLAEFSQLGIPFSFIDSLIEETNFTTYYGQHSFQSGYIAAKLALSTGCNQAQVLVVKTQRKGEISNQTQKREQGFRQYIDDNKLAETVAVLPIELKDDDEEANLALLKNTLETHRNIQTAVMFNSKVHVLAHHFETLDKTNIRLIGYDLLEKNVQYLQQGAVSHLIAQRPDKQAYYSVRDMCKQLIFKQQITAINFVPIDILIKENISYYNAFNE